jgi:hypothetical protein
MIGLVARLTYKSVRQGMRLSDALKADAERERTATERMLAQLDPDHAQALTHRIARDAADASGTGPGDGASPRSTGSGEVWDTSRSVPPPR